MFTRHTYPPSGTNQLTEQLIAQGVDPMDSGTWPEDVYCLDGEHFMYKWEWQYARIWQAPCGVMHKGHAAEWGALYVEGVYHCRENYNPLFRCPYPGKPCPHRLALPAGINCESHLCAEEYDEAHEIDRIEQERQERAWRKFEDDREKHPGYDQPCLNAHNGRIRWRLHACRDCRNTCCPARGWAPRDISPANIYYDLDIERVNESGLIPDVKRTITKGLKVFEKPIARTDAEFALAIWRKDPQSPAIPWMMESKLRGYTYEGSDGYKLQLRKRYCHESEHVTVTITGIYIAAQEQRDLIADLEAVRDGAEVIHASDRAKAAAAEKSAKRKQAEIERSATMLANGSNIALWGLAVQKEDSKRVRQRKEEMRAAIIKRAEEIKEMRARKDARQKAKGEQLTMFGGGDMPWQE